jgi:hypothetical protein
MFSLLSAPRRCFSTFHPKAPHPPTLPTLASPLLRRSESRCLRVVPAVTTSAALLRVVIILAPPTQATTRLGTPAIRHCSNLLSPTQTAHLRPGIIPRAVPPTPAALRDQGIQQCRPLDQQHPHTTTVPQHSGPTTTSRCLDCGLTILQISLAGPRTS